MYKPKVTAAMVLLMTGPVVLAQDLRVPTNDDLMALEIIRSAEISPDARHVAFGTFKNDFEADKDMGQLWLAAADGGEPHQLTRGKESVGEYEWSADGQRLAFMRDGKLFLIHIAGGESVAAELDAEGISNLSFAPDGSALFFTAGPKDKALIEAREERYGKYNVYREDGGFQHIWKVAVDADASLGDEPEQLTFGQDFSVVGYAVSPDGEQIAFATWPTPHMADLLEARLYVMASTGGEPALVDDTPGTKSDIIWHPDGRRFTYTNGRTFPGYPEIIVRRSDGSPARTWEMTDYAPTLVRFDDKGIVFSAGHRTAMNLYNFDSGNGEITRLSADRVRTRDYTYSRDGSALAWLQAGEGQLSELVVGEAGRKIRRERKLTRFSDQLEGLQLPTKELVTWTSYDGLEIEGVLTKPVGFEPGKRYPLFVRTHGGPTGTDRPLLAGAPRGIYLPEVLSGEGGGALVLQTNYRGSANYGEAFQTSNLRNLGLGPARDIIAGVKMLISQGLVDPDRVGCLGWSQGGHISAMLATYSDICTAAIMGAGISDWRTYYYNTDITQFTTEYFAATPLDDEAIYVKTSPVSYIDNATTPVLIQHGENDQRVPIANGYQLRQLLLDKGVDARMIVYSGMGHGPGAPRTRRAINEHALAWFREHLFGADPADFVHPVEPESESESESGASTTDPDRTP